MADVAKLKIELDAAGSGKVFLDGMEISHCVRAVSFHAGAGSLTEATITISAEVDAALEARLDQIALKKAKPEVRTIRALDGRDIPVRSRTPN